MNFTDYLRKNKPEYAHLIEKIEVVIGHTPDWEDLTKSNLHTIKNVWLERLSANSVKTYMAVIQSVMNQVNEDIDLPKNFAEGMKVKKQASTSVYLTEQEIERLVAFVPKNSNQEFARAMFLLQYYTGCRYSDAINIDQTNIQDGELTYVSQKTKIAVSVPVKPIVRELIRTTTTAERPCKRSYINLIKAICLKSGIKTEVKIFKGGKSVTGKKYQFVGTHTARRSFATNLLLRGADIYTISKLMGHSSVEMTMRYICSQVVLNDKLKNFFE